MGMNLYTRPDGVIGCGFVINWGGLQQHSVAWPDSPAQRYRDEDLADRGIESLPAVVGDSAIVTGIDGNGSPILDKIKLAVPDNHFTPVAPSSLEEPPADDPESDGEPAASDLAADDATDQSATDQPTGDQATGEPAGDPERNQSAPNQPAPSKFDPTQSEAANIRIALEAYPEATNRDIIEMLHAAGIEVSSSQVSRERKALAPPPEVKPEAETSTETSTETVE